MKNMSPRERKNILKLKFKAQCDTLNFS